MSLEFSKVTKLQLCVFFLQTFLFCKLAWPWPYKLNYLFNSKFYRKCQHYSLREEPSALFSILNSHDQVAQRLSVMFRLTQISWRYRAGILWDGEKDLVTEMKFPIKDKQSQIKSLQCLKSNSKNKKVSYVWNYSFLRPTSIDQPVLFVSSSDILHKQRR